MLTFVKAPASKPPEHPAGEKAKEIDTSVDRSKKESKETIFKKEIVLFLPNMELEVELDPLLKALMRISDIMDVEIA